ncbi:MFS transporter [Bacillus smithii]|uniref:MFS transporter n=1 Tax=Bacillus smithii TaxID=1479 RepID=UPI002E24AB4E|nr:MFS transporter [Bacillus smithii]
MNDALKQNTRKLLGIAGFAWLFDAMDVGMLSFIQAALQKDWNLSVKEMGWIGSVNSIGMAAGAFLFGLLADRIGRKPVFLITLLLFTIGSGLSAFTSTLVLFLFFRFFIGMGLGGELPVASTLVSESVPAKDRGRTIVLLESFWAGGWLLAAVVSYFIIPEYGWRMALLLGAIPALYALYLRWNLPDSARFQSVKTKRSFILNIKEVWSRPHIRKTIMLWIVWFCVVFSYYGMFLWLPSIMVMKGFSLIKSFGYVLIMTLAQLPGYFTAAWLIDRIGRKWVLIIFLLGTSISAWLFGNAETLPLLITYGILLSFFNLGAWGALYAYSPEQYPTAIRGTGVGMATSFGRIGGILGPLLIGFLGSETSISTIFSIFCAAIIISVVSIALLGTETKAKDLA